MEIITKKLLIKRVILIVVILLWTYLVFYLSNENGNKTTKTSSYVVDIVEYICLRFSSISTINTGVITFIIRKIAHFILYFIGSFPVFLLFNTYNINKIKMCIFTITFCTIYACSDELHQLLVQGRNGNVFDVIIDIFGCISGIVFLQAISNLICKSRIRGSTNECN